MLHLPLKLPSFSAVAAGQTANLTIPKGPTYRGLFLEYRTSGTLAVEADMSADITGIRVKVNGVVRWESSAADLIMTLKYQGFTVDAGILPIHFARPTLRTPVMEEATAWGTADVDTLTLEVDIASGATAPTLVGHALVTPDSRPLGPIIQRTKFSYAATTAGVFEVPDLPKSNGDLFAIHFASSVVTGLELLIDGSRIADVPKVVADRILKDTGRVPQANVYHFDPTFLDRTDDRIALLNRQDVRFKLTVSGAGAVPIIMETVNAPLGLPQPARR
jgi:hypothetical protein